MYLGFGLEYCIVMMDERIGDLVKCKKWKLVIIIVIYVNLVLWF